VATLITGETACDKLSLLVKRFVFMRKVRGEQLGEFTLLLPIGSGSWRPSTAAAKNTFELWCMVYRLAVAWQKLRDTVLSAQHPAARRDVEKRQREICLPDSEQAMRRCVALRCKIPVAVRIQALIRPWCLLVNSGFSPGFCLHLRILLIWLIMIAPQGKGVVWGFGGVFCRGCELP
jgi:hypothetical protein